MSDERYRVVYDEAVRASEEQSDSLNEMRSRVGMTLGSTVIATAFFGTIGITSGHVKGLQWLALALFVAASVLQVGLLVPTGDWKFHRSPQNLIRDYVESTEPASLDDMYRDVALNIGLAIRANEKRMGTMWWWFIVALGLVVAEMGAWLLAIAYR